MLVVDYEHFSLATVFNNTVQYFIRGEIQLEFAQESFLVNMFCYLNRRSLLNAANLNLLFLDIDLVLCPYEDFWGSASIWCIFSEAHFDEDICSWNWSNIHLHGEDKESSLTVPQGLHLDQAIVLGHNRIADRQSESKALLVYAPILLL